MLFKTKRKELKRELNHARENYLKNSLINLSRGASVWSKFEHLGFEKNSTSTPLNHFDQEELNEYFANIVQKHPPCDSEFLNELPVLYFSTVPTTFNWSKIDIVDFTKLLHITVEKLKGQSNGGLDIR